MNYLLKEDPFFAVKFLLYAASWGFFAAVIGNSWLVAIGQWPVSMVLSLPVVTILATGDVRAAKYDRIWRGALPERRSVAGRLIE